jgi:two-component system response regulator FixJ
MMHIDFSSSPEQVSQRQLSTERLAPIGVVDDDASVCDSLGVLLEAFGFPVLTYNSGSRFLADERHRRLGCLIVDHHMPEMDGLDVVTALQREGLSVPTILITGRLVEGVQARAAALGVAAVLEKPFPVARLIELVRAGLNGRGAG